MQECQCELAGYCNRYNLYMTPIMHRVCKSNPETYGNEPWTIAETIIPPSLPRKIMNYAVAEVKHTLSGRQNVTNEVYEKRMKICESCPLFEATKKVCQHQDCGCFLEIKAKWADSECPIGNWGKSSNDIAVGCGSCGSATAKS